MRTQRMVSPESWDHSRLSSRDRHHKGCAATQCRQSREMPRLLPSSCPSISHSCLLLPKSRRKTVVWEPETCILLGSASRRQGAELRKGQEQISRLQESRTRRSFIPSLTYKQNEYLLCSLLEQISLMQNAPKKLRCCERDRYVSTCLLPYV